MMRNSFYESAFSAAQVEAACEAAVEQDVLYEDLLLEQQEQM